MGVRWTSIILLSMVGAAVLSNWNLTLIGFGTGHIDERALSVSAHVHDENRAFFSVSRGCAQLVDS